jgi:hypothetical protein
VPESGTQVFTAETIIRNTALQYFFLLTFSPQVFMLCLCSLFSNNVRGEVFRRALSFYIQKAGRYNIPSHLILYKQIVRAQSNMRPFG